MAKSPSMSRFRSLSAGSKLFRPFRSLIGQMTLLLLITYEFQENSQSVIVIIEVYYLDYIQMILLGSIDCLEHKYEQSWVDLEKEYSICHTRA